MIELCCEYLYVRCIWLYVIIMSSTSFRVNPHTIVRLNVKKLLARSRCDIWSLSVSNGIQTHNHLVFKQTLNHLAKRDFYLFYYNPFFKDRVILCFHHNRYGSVPIFISDRPSVSIGTYFFRHDFRKALFRWKTKWFLAVWNKTK